MVIGFIICLFLTLICGFKLAVILVHHHACVSSGKYKGDAGTLINAGIIVTSVAATATMVFHHFI